MYGNVFCAPNATRRPAIQRPATQQPANRRPATQRPTTSNSQPRVPRPGGGRRPGSKSPEAGDHAARVQEGGQEARVQKARSPEARSGKCFRTGGRNLETAAANVQDHMLAGRTACDPETCDSAASRPKTSLIETHDRQLAAQSPTTRRRQKTGEQIARGR